MTIYNPPRVPRFVVADTVVWDGVGASPPAWGDLDLSAVVGAQETLVLLKIVRGANDPGFTGMVTRGGVDPGNGITSMDITAQGVEYFYLVVTDSAGFIEWDTTAAVTLVVVTVVAYLIP